MNKYPKRPEDVDYMPYNDSGNSQYRGGRLFRMGVAIMHAQYMIEMSRKHPIMYWLWYRWWVPSLLHEDERKRLDSWQKVLLEFKYNPYWADFSMYHPVQFLVFLLLRNACKFFVNSLTTPIKIIGRLSWTKNTVLSKEINNLRVKDELVEQ